MRKGSQFRVLTCFHRAPTKVSCAFRRDTPQQRAKGERDAARPRSATRGRSRSDGSAPTSATRALASRRAGASRAAPYRVGGGLCAARGTRCTTRCDDRDRRGRRQRAGECAGAASACAGRHARAEGATRLLLAPPRLGRCAASGKDCAAALVAEAWRLGRAGLAHGRALRVSSPSELVAARALRHELRDALCRCRRDP